MAFDDDKHPYPERAEQDVAPGDSGPGEPGYEGRATIGDEGAAAGPESYVNPSPDLGADSAVGEPRAETS